MKHLLLFTFLFSLFTGLLPAQTSGQFALQQKNAGAGYTIVPVTPLNNGIWTFNGAGTLTIATAIAESQVTGLTASLAAKQTADSDLTAIAGVITTSYGRSVLALADAAALRTYAGLGTSSVLNAGTAGGEVLLIDSGGDVLLSNTQNIRAGFFTFFNGSLSITVAGPSTFSGNFLQRISNRSGTIPAVDDTGGLVNLSDEITGQLPTANLADDAVTNAKAANMAQGTVKGRAIGAGTGDSTDLTPNQVSTILDSATDPFLRTSAAGGGGGVESPGDEVAYVYPETGNDTTGDGTQETPWATIQKAIVAGKQIIILGEGAGGNITAAGSDIDVTIQGLGKDVSSIGSVNGNGFNVTIRDGGFWSFSVTSGISTNPNSGVADSGTLTMSKVYAAGVDIDTSGVPGAVAAQNGANAGVIVLHDCYAQTVVAAGGGGGAGDACTGGGNGGNGANVTALRCWLSGIQGQAGAAGADGGAGPGTQGADGVSAEVKWSNLDGSVTGFQGTDIGASRVSGTWVD